MITDLERKCRVFDKATWKTAAAINAVEAMRPTENKKKESTSTKTETDTVENNNPPSPAAPEDALTALNATATAVQRLAVN
jgi:hypothetical protein